MSAVISCSAVLFDLDGVLIDSKRSIERSWTASARRRQISASECVVVEDTPPGIAAGQAAGMRVIAVLTTYGRSELADADYLVAGVHALAVEIRLGGLRVKMDLAADARG